jgi:hypothetical protein
MRISSISCMTENSTEVDARDERESAPVLTLQSTFWSQLRLNVTPALREALPPPDPCVPGLMTPFTICSCSSQAVCYTRQYSSCSVIAMRHDCKAIAGAL